MGGWGIGGGSWWLDNRREVRLAEEAESVGVWGRAGLKSG
jgi:hypothetical protein